MGEQIKMGETNSESSIKGQLENNILAVRQAKSRMKYQRATRQALGEGFKSFCDVAGLSEQGQADCFDSSSYRNEFIGLMLLKASEHLQQDRFKQDLNKGLAEQLTTIKQEQKAQEQKA